MDRSMVGQENREAPFNPVPKDEQKWAMTLLEKYIFSPSAYSIPNDIIKHLQWERRGFSGTRDPKVLDMVLGTQKDILNHLLHFKVLKRISDTELYGNQYGLNEMMIDLTSACFSSDAGSNVNSMRRNLQAEYTQRMIQIVLSKGSGNYDHLSISAAYENLNKIKKYVSRLHGVDEPTKAHRKYLAYRIQEALDT